MTDAALFCWNCGASLSTLPMPLSRYANCPQCGKDLYCCRMCKHYDPNLHRGCREDRADPPRVKDAANFCDWLEPDPDAHEPSEGDAASAARAALEDLFKKE